MEVDKAKWRKHQYGSGETMTLDSKGELTITVIWEGIRNESGYKAIVFGKTLKTRFTDIELAKKIALAVAKYELTQCLVRIPGLPVDYCSCRSGDPFNPDCHIHGTIIKAHV